MDIKELNSFKVSDAITFHDNLNPRLFHGNRLQPAVEKQLKIIAQDFLQELGVYDINVKDITISGSNAAYSYTKHSDLDLHILVDLSEQPNDEVYKELFNAKKTLYNDSHDIKVNGIPVELYVQDVAFPVISLGEYSVLNNKWIKIPNKRRSNFDHTDAKSKYEKLAKLIEYALHANDLKQVKNVLETIKRYRQTGLEKGGEFGPENIVFKALRSQGLITKLYDLRDKLHSKKLSLSGMYQDIDEGFDQPYPITWEKGDHGDVDALARLPDGTNLSIMFNKQDNIKPDDKTWMVEFYRNNSQEVTGEGDAQKVFATVLSAIQQFIVKYKPLKIYFSASKLLDPSINYGPDDVVPNPESRAKLYDRLVQRYAKAWGYRAFRGDTHASVMYELSRIPKQKAVGEDYTMQFAAEKTPVVSPYAGVKDNQYRGSMSESTNNYLWHGSRHENKVLVPRQANDTGGKEESNKNAIYATPSAKVAIAMGLTTPGSDTGMFPNDPQMILFKGGIRKGQMVYLHKVPKDLFIKHNDREWYSKPDVKEITVPKENIIAVPVDKYLNLIRQATPADLELQKKYMKKQGVAEASGYIPSERQKNDPRFKTALTVDINPYTMKKGAKQFGWNISRAGIPPTANANGKIS